MRRSALIVGAGIGGLAAAVALRRADWEVRVLERAGNPRELGFALLLAPNAMAALRSLGLDQQILAGGVVGTRGEMRRPDGRVLRRMSLAQATARLGLPTVVALRPLLHGTLLDAVGLEHVALGSEVIAVAADRDSARATLATGETVSADVVIGADGVASVVRRVLHPTEPPARRSGLLALRGVADQVAHHLGDVTGAQYLGRGIEAGVARASESTVYWYLSIPAGLVGDDATKPRALLDRVAAGFHPPFRAIVNATRDANLRLDELLERDPLEPWGAGRVTLLGDAAHPMLPHAGQGAAQALEDAAVLGRALGDADAVEVGLRRYERTRHARTRRIVRLARRNAAMTAISNPLACALRDAAIRLVPDAVMLRSLVALAKPCEGI